MKPLQVLRPYVPPGIPGLSGVSSAMTVPDFMQSTMWRLLAMASVGASAYHGYKRHRGSVGWAIGWGIMGGLFPVITPAIAVAEGFGKPMRG